MHVIWTWIFPLSSYTFRLLCLVELEVVEGMFSCPVSLGLRAASQSASPNKYCPDGQESTIDQRSMHLLCSLDKCVFLCGCCRRRQGYWFEKFRDLERAAS